MNRPADTMFLKFFYLSTMTVLLNFSAFMNIIDMRLDMMRPSEEFSTNMTFIDSLAFMYSLDVCIDG